MTVLVIEDGTRVENANSYVTVLQFQTYLSDRGLTVTNDESELLIKAMDYLESLTFIGIKQISTQSLQWPRYYVQIDGYYNLETNIPKELKKAQMAIAYAIDQNADPLALRDQDVKREKVGEIEVEYKDGSSSSLLAPFIPASLWKLVSGGSGMLRASKG